MSEMRRRQQMNQQPGQPGSGELTDRQLIELLARTAGAGMNAGKQSAVTVEEEDGQNDIDLIELFWRVVSKLHLIILAAIVGLGIGVLYAVVFHVPTYSATAKLYILSESDTILNLSDLQLGNALGPDYSEVFKTWEVSEMVKSNMGVDYTYTELQNMLTVTIPSNSRVLYLTVKSKDAKEAANLANMFAEAGRQFIMDTMGTEKPNNFSFALVPGTPSSRGKSFYVVLGFALGALIATGLIVITFLLDNRPHSAEDVGKYTGLPILSVVPIEKGDVFKDRSDRQHQKAHRRKK